MAAGIPARLTAAEGRKFGLTVGIAFLLFAAISFWRGHPTAPLVLGALGGALTLAGLAVPTALGPVQRGWMRLGLAISKVTTPLFMGLVYFTVLTPTGGLMRLFGKNPVRRRERGGSYWVARDPGSERGGSLTRQF